MTEKLKKKQEIFFIGEKAPMIIKAISKNYAICTRLLHRWYDADMLKRKVEMGAYFSFTEAYNHLKGETVYSILDFKNNTRGPHNMIFNSFDFKKQNEINYLLSALEIGEIELSRRNSIKLNIDFSKTFKI